MLKWEFQHVSLVNPRLKVFLVQFLSKQTAALKEVNESRVRIYEQIETSLSELEESHTKLTEESAGEKVKIKRWENCQRFVGYIIRWKCCQYL